MTQPQDTAGIVDGQDELEPMSGPYDWAEAAAQGLERIAAFIRSRPEVVGPFDDLAGLVAHLEELADEAGIEDHTKR